MHRPDPERPPAQAQRTEPRKRRGRLKIFFGAVAGVGKTFAMLQAAQARRAEGCEVVAGLVEAHGRADTMAQLQGLERLFPLIKQHQGSRRTELDLDAALKRNPDLILVDQLAHANLPGSRHPKRWQDVRELLDCGIDVYTTLDVQNLESLHEDVARIAGVRILETVPDTVFEDADEVELVDLPPDELLARLQEGKIHPPEEAGRGLLDFFRKGSLIALRELALRRTADWVGAQLREYRQECAIREVWNADERILVCLAPDERANRLVRAGKRLAASLHADWLALYVETPALRHLSTRRRDGVLEALRLAERLGAETVTLSAPDMAEAILKFAREHHVNKLVLGKPGRRGWHRWFLGSVVDSLIGQAQGLNFYLLGDEEALSPKSAAQSPGEPFHRRLAQHRYRHWLWSLAIPLILTAIEWPFRALLTPGNILMFYLLGVFFVAIRFGFWPSILASLTNAAAFAYFFAPPIFSLAIAEPENLAGLAVTLLIGAVTGNLAENLRHQARVAESRERRASALHRLSKGLATARSAREITGIGAYHIHAQFGGRNTFLFPDRDGRLRHPDEPPLAISLAGADLEVARWVYQHGELAGRGTDTLPDAPAVYLPLKGSAGTLGVLALEPVELRRIFLPEHYQLLTTFLNQIVHTLERAQLAERAEEATLKMQAETLRNSLLSSISHDLRTPLATIVGAASTLETDGAQLEQTSQRRLLAAISEEAQRMSDLTIKILDMARLEAGEVRLDRQWYAPEEIVGSALRRLDKKLKSRPIEVRLADGPPLIQVDAVLLQQVLVNLLDNADKNSPPGHPIAIAVDCLPRGVSIAVADRGPGIPKGLEQTIFDKFFRVHPETAQSGAGLGLSICRAIVEAHGGEIHAASRDGGGAVFQLVLPLLESPPTLAPEAQEPLP